MEFKQLKYFIAIADTGSFSKAAQNLYITQPALSQQITKLEYELKVPLIERTTRSVHLTKAGERLYKWAIPFLRDMENIAHELQSVNQHSEEPEIVRIGLPDSEFSLDGFGIFSYLDRIRELFPYIHLDVVPFTFEESGQILESKKCLMAFSILSNNTPVNQNMEERVLAQGNMALLVPESWDYEWGSPEFIDAMSRSCIYFPEERSYWHGIFATILAENSLRPRYDTISRCGSGLNFVMSGNSVIFLPDKGLRQPSIAHCRLIPIPAASAEYRISALYRSGTSNYLLKQLLEELPPFADLRRSAQDQQDR